MSTQVLSLALILPLLTSCSLLDDLLGKRDEPEAPPQGVPAKPIPVLPIIPEAPTEPLTPSEPILPISACSNGIVSWIAPTTREDNSPISLSEIAGYNLYLSNSVIFDKAPIFTTDWSAPTGDYVYAAVTTIDTLGQESVFSNIIKIKRICT